MKIGIALDVHGGAGSAPGWTSLRAQALAADDAGFDLVVLPDHLFYPRGDDPIGAWESVCLAGGLAASTQRVRIGHSMFNLPYRPPALVAKIAVTLDEMSGGRYVCGLGAGNTSEAEYEAFGFDVDPRYARAAEGIEIVHAMLKTGRSEFDGTYHRTRGAQAVLRGPNLSGPPIVIAAHGPKMMRLAARFGDEWNGFDHDGTGSPLEPYVSMLDRLSEACLDVGRDPATLRRSLDIGIGIDGEESEMGFDGSIPQVADRILMLGEIGIDEVRCYVAPKSDPDRITALAPLVALVHDR